MAFGIALKSPEQHSSYQFKKLSYPPHSTPTISQYSSQPGSRPNTLLSTHFSFTRTNQPTNNVADSSSPTSESLYAVHRKLNPLMSLIARHCRHYCLARATQYRLFSHQNNHSNESNSRIGFAPKVRARNQNSHPTPRLPDTTTSQNRRFENTNSNQRWPGGREHVPAGDAYREPRQQGRETILKTKGASRKVQEASKSESKLGSLDFDKRFLIQFCTKASWYEFNTIET